MIKIKELVNEAKIELVNKAKNGDKEAFSELIESVYNDLYRFAKARLGNEEDAKDAVQEAIMEAYLHINSLRDAEKFKSWITTILSHHCNHMYKKKKHKGEVPEDYLEDRPVENNIDDNLNFEDIIESLNEKETEIFKLHYEDGLTTKQIAKRLRMNENTIKTTLRRGKEKIRKTYKPATIFLFILCILITTSVLAVSIISYIKSLFEIDIEGRNNEGVLMAIENLDWYQEVEMDYINLDEDNKLKVEYLLMDEMNLYLVVDVSSSKDISKYDSLSIPDLKITNEKGEVICDKSNLDEGQVQVEIGDKLIEKTSNSMKLLIYMYTESFPIAKELEISFNRMMFYTSEGEEAEIQTNNEFQIVLNDKFVNRENAEYNARDTQINKAIVSETGFYAIIETGNEEIPEIVLIDENGKKYRCWTISMNSPYEIRFKYMVCANFNDIQSKKLKLRITNTKPKTEIELTKEN